jgi:cytochrome c553
MHPCRHHRARLAACAAALLCALVCGAAVHAASSASLALRTLAASCAACHGTDGHAVRGTAMPPLAGLPRASFLRQMQAFRDGTRSAPLMQQIARGFDEAQTEALAVYFEQQRGAP